MEELAVGGVFPCHGPRMNLRPHIWLLETHEGPMRETNYYQGKHQQKEWKERHVRYSTQLTSPELSDAIILSVM